MEPQGGKTPPPVLHLRTPLHGLFVSRFLPRPSQVVRFAFQTITRIAPGIFRDSQGYLCGKWGVGRKPGLPAKLKTMIRTAPLRRQVKKRQTFDGASPQHPFRAGLSGDVERSELRG